MKKLSIFLVFIFISSALIAQTSFTADMYNFTRKGLEKPVLVTIGNHQINKKISFTGFGLVGEKFCEATVGIGIQISPALSGKFMIGIENHPDIWRVKSTWIYTKKKLFLFASGELGASGSWYSSIGTYTIHSKKMSFSLGYFQRRFEGIGPRVEYGKTKGKVAFYTMPFLWDWENKKIGTGFGLQLSF